MKTGIGRDGETLAESYKYAGLAIDMALSRGGDQAVIKNRYSFEFFGGLSEEVEKRTKVKSRVVANALSQLIRDSSQVLVMGHKNSDMDAIGAAAGMVCAARVKNKPHRRHPAELGCVLHPPHARRHPHCGAQPRPERRDRAGRGAEEPFSALVKQRSPGS